MHVQLKGLVFKLKFIHIHISYQSWGGGGLCSHIYTCTIKKTYLCIVKLLFDLFKDKSLFTVCFVITLYLLSWTF